MFPVDAEARAMCAALPGDGISEVEVPGGGFRKPSPPDNQAGLGNVNAWGA